MSFDPNGHWSWDGMKEGVQDAQPACETRAYRRGCWWVEECVIRDEDGQLIGRILARTLISDAQVGQEWAERRVKLADEVGTRPAWYGENK